MSETLTTAFTNAVTTIKTIKGKTYKLAYQNGKLALQK